MAPEPFRQISIHAVRLLARLAAKRAIEAELREEGRHATLVRPAEINERARAYLDQHPELLKVAEERARLLKLFERQPKRPRPKLNPVCDRAKLPVT